AALGDEAFLPPSRSDAHALFAFEEIVAAPVTWQFGARYERNRLASPGLSSRREGELSGSLGAVWQLDDQHSLALSVAHTGRAPNAQELLAYGAHAGTQSFEIGDASLDPERSLGLEASLRRKKGFVTGAVTLFAHRFSGYIFARPTGLVAIEHGGEWEFILADDPHAEAHGGGLPVYRSAQSDARFWGVEVETIWHLHESRGAQLDVRLAADLTRAQESGRNLPRIPAARTTAGITWATANWSVGAECQFVFDQNRIAANETSTDGYTLASAHVSRSFEFEHLHFDAFLRGTNLTNAEVRPHTSFVKDLAPLAGRGVVAGVRLSF
ncbi:MAG: TonB-dependent receptor, partial [Verrucomicrobiota bacterium]